MSVWIDTDMGVDDLFAILLTQRYHVVDGISLCFGNATLDRVMLNAAGAAEVFDWGMPIHRGADRAILGEVETAQRVLGVTGMPTRGATLPEPFRTFAPAVPALENWLEGQERARILALGPLTNLATLALIRPDLVARIGSVVWMGGAIGAGNHTASAEFNALADPEALAILLSRDLPLVMIDLDVCRRVQIAEADVADLRAAPTTHATLLADLLGGYLDISLSRGRPTMALYDPVASAALVRPDLFDLAPAELSVELVGQHTRGRTVVDCRDIGTANARIAKGVQADAVRKVCLDALGQPA